ncbi:gluconokinase [Sphingomonas fuzhouensis]|uniref:gluconokinase n=1 Tax=Sphingomonas fuzhouensis TaxID=3106033 RepID=UPI002AFF3AA1|nr:gluconokinase [Sphingomonas sp. SGZ-02]
MKATDGSDAGERAYGIVVMGVSGTGKTTLSQRLGTHLHCPVLEGDDFHSAANVAKMRSGHPLTDADRWPWLDRLGAAIGEAAHGSGVAVAACSALRRSYRERLSAAAGVPLFFVLLDTDADEIARRMRGRPGHYMPPSLLDSQLATLERPGPGECALTLDAGQPPKRLVGDTLAWVETMQAA